MKLEFINERFHLIYETTYTSCLKYVTCRCHNTNDIPDIVQEIYLSVYDTLARKGIDYIKQPEAFVIKLAKSKMFRYYLTHKKLSDNTHYDTYSYDGSVEIQTWDLMQSEFDNSTEQYVINKDLNKEIWNFLQSKPVLVQKSFYLYYYFGMTLKEISIQLDQKESTVKTWIFRTTNELRKLYAKSERG